MPSDSLRPSHSQTLAKTAQHTVHSNSIELFHLLRVIIQLLPRCIECRRGLAMRILFVRFVCLSVRRPVCQTRGLWQNGRKICSIFLPYERSFSLVFWEKWLGATPSTWNFWSTGPRWSDIADFQPIFVRRASAATPGEKSSINANRKSTGRFPMSLRWSSYVAPKPPKRGSKTQSVQNLNSKLR